MILPLAKIKDIILQEAGSELLIYNLDTNKVYSLNEISKIVYQACDGETSIEVLNTNHNLNKDLVFFTLDELKKQGLLQDNTQYESPFFGMSRREVVKKIGLTALASLPVIASVVAPSAIMAQSGTGGLRSSCASSANCAPSAPFCTTTPLNSGQMICCVGSISYYDTGVAVNDCEGPGCNIETFTCQSDANSFCCSGSTTASCVGNNCACICN